MPYSKAPLTTLRTPTTWMCNNNKQWTSETFITVCLPQSQRKQGTLGRSNEFHYGTRTTSSNMVWRINGLFIAADFLLFTLLIVVKVHGMLFVLMCQRLRQNSRCDNTFFVYTKPKNTSRRYTVLLICLSHMHTYVCMSKCEEFLGTFESVHRSHDCLISFISTHATCWI